MATFSRPVLLKKLSCALVVALSSACTNSPAVVESSEPQTVATTKLSAAELQKMYADYFEESLQRNPMRATQIGDNRFNDQMPDSGSEAHRQRELAAAQTWALRVKNIDSSSESSVIPESETLSYQLFRYQIERNLAQQQWPNWQMPINQFRSAASQWAILGSGQGAQPFKTKVDYQNWRKRASHIPRNIDTTIANMRIGMQNGYVQPKVLMQKVLPQLDALIKDRAEDAVFWRPITNLPADLTVDRADIEGEYRTLINTEIMPAFRKLRQFINDEYLPTCRDTVAWSVLPDGQRWYAELVKQQTTTDFTPQQIHDIGLREVARIQGEMLELGKKRGLKPDLKAIFEFYQSDKSFEYPTEQALLDDYNAFRVEVEAGVSKLFRLVPKAAYEIRPVEAFRAASAAGGQYNGPSQDGSRPGIFYVNTFDLPSRKSWDKEALFLHEAIPGHHFQIALQQELTDLPMFRRFGGETAFSEGWGLYAESLGYELGVYKSPDQYFGRLQAELWRSIRLVVDTGLHAKGWTRERVIDYMMQNSATNLTEATSEAERYIAIPGQALAYKIGELKILELRERAESQLGDRFDVREFHAEVLKDGAIPLMVLSEKINRWIEQS